MICLKDYQKRLWAEIDCDAIAYNFAKMGDNVCCVIKANAYGHGSVVLARMYEKMGASYFAVSNIEEAIQLRRTGISIPILVLGYTPKECASFLYQYKVDQCIYNYEYAVGLNNECAKLGITIRTHIKIDTGMGRIGFRFCNGENELPLALKACCLPFLKHVGIFTHFAVSDEGVNQFTKEQFSYFNKACLFFEKNNVFFQIKHCSNSAAIIDYLDYRLDMVRAGIALYGINPTSNKSILLKPVLSLWSVVSNVKKVRKGDSVSYGRTFIADKDMIVATIPIGYADGFWRSNQGHHVYINGEYCKIIGRICMDQIMVECNNAKMGDLVEIYGKHVPVEEVAKYNNTISYEILCAIGERVPRVYIKNGKIIKIIDKLV